MKQAVVYTRFSPRPDKRKGRKSGRRSENDKRDSCAFQELKCRQYCKLHGMEIYTVYSDKMISGKSISKRIGLIRAMNDVCYIKGVLVFYSLSRFARSTKDAIKLSETLNKCGADFVSITENLDTSTAMGRVIFTIMAALAQFERETTSERTKDMMKQLKIDGRRYNARYKYGYMPDPKSPGMLIKSPEEQENIQLILRLYANGQGISRYKICNELNRRKIPCRRTAKQWHYQTVRNIITDNTKKITGLD